MIPIEPGFHGARADSAIVIGGGFFGSMIAVHLRASGVSHVTLCEREPRLLARASYSNQARVHSGCHYPRAFLTAYRSRTNLPRFSREFGAALKRDFTCVYAIAARRSKVRAAQFERFMHDIGARYERAASGYRGLFDPRVVAAAYIVDEYAFDAARLRDILGALLTRAGVDVRLGTEALRVLPEGQIVRVETRNAARTETLEATLVINCTYARTNWTVRQSSSVSGLKHELAEIALVDVPAELQDVGVTVMDGPFFSCMPFPAEQCHSLSHVRYTPHGSVCDPDGAVDPLLLLDERCLSRADSMLADAARFVPALRRSRHRSSLFEVKTVLLHHEVDDGRPILLRRDFAHPGVLSVLGGKLDNIYDVLAELDRLLGIQGSRAATEAA
ncbi:MAG TPA: FAD-dependent oxidoreductase [Steroidobacteraceae bacterium]|jgi:glycine/D-amino acid oxidase-like deaminating enzyme